MKKKIDERDILEKIKGGDRSAYRFLFDNYFNILCLYALSLTKCTESAKDIVQNVFLNLWVKKELISIDNSLKNYLYKSVYHNFLNDYKKRKREKNFLDQLYEEALNELIAEQNYILEEKLVLLNKTIEKLPSKSKEIFILNKRQGFSYKEISNILNISESTVESHIGRALKRLRLELAPPSRLEDF